MFYCEIVFTRVKRVRIEIVQTMIRDNSLHPALSHFSIPRDICHMEASIQAKIWQSCALWKKFLSVSKSVSADATSCGIIAEL